jgi:hypothetical protein
MLYPFTIVRPDRAVVIWARSIESLREKLQRWSTLPADVCMDAARPLWRGIVVRVPAHETVLLRGEVRV